MHFSNGSSLDRDGTRKHGAGKPTRTQEEWLREDGRFRNDEEDVSEMA